MQTYGRLLAAFLFLALAGLNPSAGQTPATPAVALTNAAPVVAAPAAVPLADVVTEAVADSGKVQAIQDRLASDETAAVSENLPIMTAEIDRRGSEDAALLGNNPSISVLRTASASWQMLSNSLDAAKQDVDGRIAVLNTQIGDLGQMKAKWQATMAQSSGFPPAVLDRVKAVITGIAQATKATTALRTRLLSLQDGIAEQAARIAAARATIGKAQASAVNQLLVRDGAPLWDMNSHAAPTPAKMHNSFAGQVGELQAYVAEKFPTFFIHLALFLVFAGLLFWARGELRGPVGDDPDMRQAAAIFEVPLATAIVVAILISGWLYPLAPPLFMAGLGMVALVPIVLILRRLVELALYPILYALFASYFVDEVRLLAAGGSWTGRALFLGELAAGCIFLFWLLRSKRLGAAGADAPLEQFVRVYARLALVLLAAAFVANGLGYTRLSALLGGGLLRSSYLLVLLYAAVRILDGLLLGALKLRPFSALGMVRHHGPLLRRRVVRILRGAAFLFWLWEALELFLVRAPLWKGAAWTLNYQVHLGSVPLSLAPLLCFALTIWATVLLSKFIRYILEQEVYPKLRLGRGVPYAASTLVHYTVLVLGSLFALATMGIDLRQYSVLAGALGVGLGFGLQNIMNNFVSGIILLFERPIKVGDVIQVDANMGTVESIGIHASVIRITNGSELILPNGNLISNPVTNWTFSNRQRVVDLPVAVAVKNDTRRVMALLVETAKAHPLVLQDPAPQVLLTNFSGASINLELRAWTAGNESWLRVRNELALAVSEALARENIAIA